MTLHDKLAKIVVRCTVDFMPRQHNLHYKIASQQKLKSDAEYIPKVSQIKLELSDEKGTKEGEAFQALQERHTQVLADCQLQLKPLVVEAEDLDLVKKNKLAIISFVELIHDISKGFLAYDDRQDINAHQCSVDIIELYSNHNDVRLNASKERLLEEYQKKHRKLKRCLPRTSPTPRLHPPRLYLFMINLPP